MANYDNNIVNPDDLLSDSQSEIQQNFQAILDLISVNHYPFGDPNAGKHQFMTHLANRGNIGRVNPATEKLSYGKRYAPTNKTEWFASTNAASGFLLSGRNDPFQQPTWSMIADKGIAVVTMTVVAARGPLRVIFPAGQGIPTFSNVLNVQLSIESSGIASPNNGSAYITAFDRLGVDVQVYSNVAGNMNAFGFFVMAIGTIGPVF